MSSWLKNEVATAQLNVAIRVLAMPPMEVAPFRYFLEAIKTIRPVSEMSLLDVGCGVGMYGVLCSRYMPNMKYRGTDFSEEMIKCARALDCQGDYSVCEFEDNSFEDYDIILLSGILEYAGTWQALNTVMQRLSRYAVLNRIRVIDAPSQAVMETTYCGNSEQQYLWNRGKLLETIGDRLVKDIAWEDGLQHTLVLRSEY